MVMLSQEMMNGKDRNGDVEEGDSSDPPSSTEAEIIPALGSHGTRASPVSSEGSNAEGARLARLANLVLASGSHTKVLSGWETMDQPPQEGTIPSNNESAKDGAEQSHMIQQEQQQQQQQQPGHHHADVLDSSVAENSRTSREGLDEATGAGHSGTESIPTSYKSLEEKIGAESERPSSVYSTKSPPEQEAASGGASPQSGSGNDGPPRIITTKSATATSGGRIAGSMRRRGKWTVEEEAYVARVIQDFNSGFLDAPAGTTLRTFLSDKLNCDPMRITKKFTGEACIGKRVFHPAIRSPSNAAAIDKAQSELEALERRWRRRLEMQQRESAKKAAASAAAAAAAASSSSVPMEGTVGTTAVPHNPILQTATWLDRAKSLTSLPSNNIEDLPRSEVMIQMQAVERLLHEGSTMQRTSASLSHFMDQTTDQVGSSKAASGTESPPPEPADKRLRTGAEDAEALVGFLRSVRASAASGQEF